MDKYLLVIILLIIFSIIFILYVRISDGYIKEEKDKSNSPTGDNFTLLE